ncbi:MAG: D-2-hydroxyacid dehydrogenase [Pseudomonadales bacterium]|nr:D-2-hydroxyacid dehydrogenase [Pseudomonadales bacterium]
MLGVILDADSLGNDVDLSPITSLLDEWQVYPFTRPEDVADRIANADIVLSNKIRLEESNLGHADQLKFVSVIATGTNNIDFPAMAERGVVVSNARGYGTPSVVQHTLTMILMLSTNLHRYLSDVASGKWQKSDAFCLLHHPVQEVAGKKLGIVGYGELGKAVAAAVEALGMSVVVSERPGVEPRTGRLAFDDVLNTADYVSLHCPLTEDNEHMINKETLGLMKPGAHLINTARGGLVHSVDLVAALKEGVIAGAAIDVLDREPPPADDPLLEPLSNLIVTPHNAWGAIESRTRLIMQTRENIEGFLNGEPVRVVENS